MKRYFFSTLSSLAAIVLVCLFYSEGKAATSTQNREFIPVDGSSLQSRLETAVKLFRSRIQRMPFWVAYSFEVRPGIVVDPEPPKSEVTARGSSGGTIKIGLCSDAAKETRNLAIFLQFTSDGGSIERLEVYNLDHSQAMASSPVYWLGRVASRESLDFLFKTAETNPHQRVAEHSIAAISMHVDEMASSKLPGFVLGSSNKAARLSAVFWLGQFGVAQSFLVDLVRNERLETEIRMKAAFAIGTSKQGEPFEALKNLFESISSRQIKRHILLALSITQDSDKTLPFLIFTAENNPDFAISRHAVLLIGMRAGRYSSPTEKETDDSPRLPDGLEARAIFDISRRPKNEAVPVLARIAKTHPKATVRNQALFWLSRIDVKHALELYKEILFK